MEVAATAAKIATAAPTMAEGASVAASAAQATATGAEAVNAATAATEALQGAKTVEALGGAAKVIEAAPEAAQAAKGLETSLKTAAREGASPEKVMKEFTAETPVEASAGGDVATEIKDVKAGGEAAPKDATTTTAAETPTPTGKGETTTGDTKTATPAEEPTEAKADASATAPAEKIKDPAQREIDKAVHPQMTEWDKSNPPPDQEKEPAKYKEWMQQRAAAEKQYTVTEGVKHDMAEWDKQNPPPDKEKNPEAYQQWEKRRAEKESQSRQTREQRYDQMRNEREEQQRGMSKEEFMRKAARLQELQTLATSYAMNIQELSISRYQTETSKAQLVRLRQILNQTQTEIATLQAELQLDAAIDTKQGWKKMLLPMIIMGALILAPAMSGTGQE